MRPTHLEVLDTPAEFDTLAQQDLQDAACVVLDVLRATSSMVAALGAGAIAIRPVAGIPEALAEKRQDPSLLLAGERHGLRIRAAQSGGIEFDFGNSPREFTPESVAGRRIAMTTTNGTRALQATARASLVLVGSFLNLQATADALHAARPRRLILVASGTFEEAALEDVVAAGALCNLLWDDYREGDVADSALIARLVYQHFSGHIASALHLSRNGRRLLAQPALAEDIAFAARTNAVPLLTALHADGWVRSRPPVT